MFISYLMQSMKPELNPCFYYISSRGFDRILTVFGHLFGGFIEIVNQVNNKRAEPMNDNFS